MKSLVVSLAFLFSALAVAQAPRLSSEREISQLFTALKRSGCEFNRNGSWYDSDQAVTHLQKKYEYLIKRDLVATTEIFIERAASNSSMSGKPYSVRCNNASSISSSTWFKQQLRQVRQNSRSGANNSFKPNSLRYGNNMAEKLAMLSPPLRKSA